jgi:hypothetical protein
MARVGGELGPSSCGRLSPIVPLWGRTRSSAVINGHVVGIGRFANVLGEGQGVAQ